MSARDRSGSTGESEGAAGSATTEGDGEPVSVVEIDLTSVPTMALERLHQALSRSESRERSSSMAGPGSSSVRPALLSRLGLEDHAAVLARLGQLPATGARLLLGSVLAERRRLPRTEVELVWTGPEAATSASRSSAVVLRQLFASAGRAVIVGGYAFDHGAEIFEPLHQAMRERAVQVQLFLDLAGEAKAGQDVDRFAADCVERFLRSNWPFGDPIPEIWYDPRTAAWGASLHAKCVVVDWETALVTSANFTDRGQTRNLEVGVLVRDGVFARGLAEQWRGLIAAGLVRRYRG